MLEIVIKLTNLLDQELMVMLQQVMIRLRKDSKFNYKFSLLRKVAIKKLNKIEDEVDAKRILREIKIQKNLKHPNILPLFNIVYDNTVIEWKSYNYQIKNQDFGDIYLISPYYPADLSKIIKSGQELSVDHLQYIMY